MAKITTRDGKAVDERDLAELGLRETVLETLLQLHIDFGSLGRMEVASPLLYELMELAYYALPTGRRSPSAPKPRARKRDAKATLN